MIKYEEVKSMDEGLKDSILNALEMVIDPELGIDIVNLGLVYNVDVDDEGLCTCRLYTSPSPRD